MLSRCRPLLGTFVEVTAKREDPIDAAFAAMRQVHRLMSAHEPDSDVSRINRFGHVRPIEVHEWTARVLERALYWSKRSGGAFDVVRAGKMALEHQLIPRHPDQPQPEAAHWTWLDVQGRSVRLLKAGCIDLGGIAKGFAVDRSIDALRDAGCERGLVNAGGDLRGFGPEAWPVTVVEPLTRRPIAAIEIDNEALATSAGLSSGEGRLSFDHLGRGNPHWASVSVLAGTACDADALAKIIWNVGADAAALLRYAGAKALGLTAADQVEAIGEIAEAAA